MRKLTLAALWTCIGALTLSTGGCGDADKENAETSSRQTNLATAAVPHKNVILILLDTVRRDKLGCYASHLGATPNIDQLAGQSLVFDNAYAHAPWTLPATASILTSQYPPQHGAGGSVPNFKRLPDDARTIAETFRDAGYATAEIVNVDFLTETFGLTQGFEHVDFEAYQSNVLVRTAEPTTDAALAWLNSRSDDRPFFLLVHYFDAHLVYDPPKPQRMKFAEVRDRGDSAWAFGTRSQIVAYRRGELPLTEKTVRRAEKLYNGEIAYIDQEIGRLLHALPALGLKDVVLALTADHGEEFWDHRGFEHGHSLYNELVRVPLIIHDPAQPQARRVETVVGHVDLAPTLCDLAGIKIDPAFAGRSLAPAAENRTLDHLPVIFQGNFWGPPLRARISDGYKLIRRPDRPVELYDVFADPTELDNLAERYPELVARLTDEMNAAFEQLATTASETPQLTPQQLERLKSLGYAGGQDDDD